MERLRGSQYRFRGKAPVTFRRMAVYGWVTGLLTNDQSLGVSRMRVQKVAYLLDPPVTQNSRIGFRASGNRTRNRFLASGLCQILRRRSALRSIQPRNRGAPVDLPPLRPNAATPHTPSVAAPPPSPFPTTGSRQSPAHIREQALEASGRVGIGEEPTSVAVVGPCIASQNPRQIGRELGLGYRPLEDILAGAADVEYCRNAHPPTPPPPYSPTPFSRRISHTRSGRIGISICVTPRCASASTTAFAIAGGAPTVADSPTPFAPSG